MKRLATVILATFMLSTSAEAQFFKKLKRKVEQKVENAVIEDVSDRAANKATQSLDSLWATDLSGMALPMGGERVDPSELPASYDFDYQYTLDMETSEGNMEMVYLIKEGAPYMGIIMPQMQGMTMVMDTEKGYMAMFMDSQGAKMLTATKLDVEGAVAEEVDNPYADIEYRELEPKEILGYTCKGYQATTDDYDITFYVTDEAGVSFSELFQDKKNMPKNFNPEWLEKGNGLMMEMNMEDRQDPKKSVSMTCTGIEKKEYSIRKSDYQMF